MRFLYAILISLSVFSFSGAAEVLPEFFGDKHEHCNMSDGDCSKEDKTEKEDGNEREDEMGKESILNLQLVFCLSDQSKRLLAQCDALREMSFSPEDHPPPPELI